MIRSIVSIIILGLLLSSNSFVSQSSETKGLSTLNKSTTTNDTDQLQQIINDFKSYAAKIPAEVRDEVKKYRIEKARINSQKRALYKRISQEAQNYLSKVQEYKKKLALSKKNLTMNQENMQVSKNNLSKIDH